MAKGLRTVEEEWGASQGDKNAENLDREWVTRVPASVKSDQNIHLRLCISLEANYTPIKENG